MHETADGTNRLGGETSPYLLQHAHNPVQWYPWGDEALARAAHEDKPILLSIGYSACHWCHVMAHESFEDPATAEQMNRLFINVKVDREERPDLDKIYQLAHQMLAHRSGGWPLTMFLTPGSLIPFFGGTYFPRVPRYGMPAFGEVLERIAAFYREHRKDLEAQNAELMTVFTSLGTRAPADHAATLEASVLDMARNQLGHSFDPVQGGFGQAPKFPHPSNIERMLRHWAASKRRGQPDDQALHMAVFTLEKMARGGIYDHLGGGFCRYAVDGQWMIPHFEKMLYDNAQLLPLYAQAWRAIGTPLFRRAALETADWVVREMQAPAGGYYSALDADSEGEEGKYYVWSRDEARSLLDDAEYRVFATRFGLDRDANFEGHWHLRIASTVTEIARAHGEAEELIRKRLDAARTKLLAARQKRVPPGCDDKVLTAWNALMVRGMAVAARQLEEPGLLDSAERALAFIREHLWNDGRLLATCRDGRAHLRAYLDDYAFLLDALLELLQARWRSADLDFSVQLAEALLAHFEDRDVGGFFFTAHDHETLIHRPKPFGDDALPAGNAVAARALGRLGHLLGEARYLDAAERTLRAAWPQLAELPYAHNAMLDALEEYLEPPLLVLIRAGAEEGAEWLRVARSAGDPDLLAFAIPHDAGVLPGVLGTRRAEERRAIAYVCRGASCSAPAGNPAELLARLQEPR
ncbi:MAG: thioredoxin domain-containing protein [Gammaproteobacteria bacterium]|nr:thioredoxin domain-containing protein [Gammaproteobacteria bacterium]